MLGLTLKGEAGVETSDGQQTAELRDLIARLAGRDGVHQTAIPSLYLIRYSVSKSPDFGVIYPGLCIVAQGQKELLLGGEVFANRPGQYLVSSAEIPLSARVVGATSAKPHLGLILHFDLASLRSLIEEARLPSPPGGALQRGIYVSRTGPALLDAVSRVVRLLRSPAEIPVLAPMIEREILFRLLQDESSVVLHQMARASSPPQRIGVAIVWLKRHFRESLRVEDLARRVGMSTSGFHQWFRNITGMSPLQYQKQLRLQEARSILRNERKDVGTVSRRVGYESPSQFSREYNRLFGNPPVREISEGLPSKASSTLNT
jgi:AraC-like DNA-binding protein